MSQAKKDAHNKKYPGTGGGPQPQVSEWTETIQNVFGLNNPIFHGIEQGGESGNTSLFSEMEASENFSLCYHLLLKNI